jgi:AAA domain
MRLQGVLDLVSDCGRHRNTCRSYSILQYTYVYEHSSIAILHVYVRTEEVAGTAGVPSAQFKDGATCRRLERTATSKEQIMWMATAWWEQDEAGRRALTGENLFVMGGAGTGKTETLKRIFQSLLVTHRQHGESAVWLTAMSGPAAWRLGGMTLASFAGWQDVDLLCDGESRRADNAHPPQQEGC